MSFPALYTPHTQAAPPCIPAALIHIRNPHASQFLHIGLMHTETSAGLRQACTGSHPYASAALRQFTKNRKVRNLTSRKPHTAAHASQILTASDSHTGHVPIRFRGSPIQPPSSKNPDIGFDKTSVSGPANQAPAGLHEFPAPTAGAVPHVQAGHHTRRDQRPVYSNARPTNLLKFTALTRGAWVWRRFATRRRRRSGGPAFKPA